MRSLGKGYDESILGGRNEEVYSRDNIGILNQRAWMALGGMVRPLFAFAFRDIGHRK